jgi:hypothetical protein
MPRLSTIRRNGPLAAVVLVSLLLLPCTAGAQPARPYPTGTAALAGRAVDAATGGPVANTLIGLSRRRTSGANAPSDTSVPLLLVMADAQGRFVIRDIPAGHYLILATAPGYIISNYGQARAAGPSRTIDLEEGDLRLDLEVPLWTHAIISGTVRDEAGDPMVGVTVRALRRANNGPGGVPRYMPGSLATTDDRGRYRLSRLTPGEFLVTVPRTQVTVPAAVIDDFVQSVAGRGGTATAARLVDELGSSSAVPLVGGGVRVDDFLLLSTGDDSPLAVPPPVDGALSVYPTAYHGSIEPISITVESGEERTDVDLVLAPEPALRITGRVTADGVAAPNVVVRLVRVDRQTMQGENGFEAAATVSGADGAFTLLGVTPGRYLIKAVRLSRPRLPPAMAANPALVAAYDVEAQAGGRQPLVGAQVPLSVGDADLNDLEVSLRAGATVSGRIEFAGGAPPAAELRRKIGVLLSSEDGGLPGVGFQIAPLGDDDTFSRAAPAPGRFLLTGLAIPSSWRLSAITRDGHPLTDALDLTGDDVSGVVMTYTDQLAAVAGTARNASGLGEIGAEIVVFPAERRLWLPESLNVRSPQIQQAPTDGRFLVPGLLPGDYFVAVVDARDIPEVAGPEFFEAVSAFATRTTLTAGQRTTLQLTVGRIR